MDRHGPPEHTLRPYVQVIIHKYFYHLKFVQGTPSGILHPGQFQGIGEHLTLQFKLPQTVDAQTCWVAQFAAFHNRSPYQMGQPEIRACLLQIITENKLCGGRNEIRVILPV